MMEDDINILVIDDDEVDRLTLKRSFKKSELDVHITECKEPQQALDLLKAQKFDCIFLDYLMPGTDGLKLLKKIKKENVKAPIIIVTSQGDEKVAVEMMKAGASDYLVKDQVNVAQIEKIIHYVIQLREVEKEKEAAQAALKVSESQLAEAQRVAKIGNFSYHFPTNEVRWSEEMYNIFEVSSDTYQPDEHSYRVLFLEEDQKFIEDAMYRSMQGEHCNLDVRAVMPKGKVKYVNLQTYFVYDKNGNQEQFAGTVQDIHKRKTSEQELEKAKKVAEESVKVKEQFLANMSHEIRTPMNSIIGFTNLLMQDEDNLKPEHKKYIQSIHHAGENLLVIINDILDFSKIQSGKLNMERVGFVLPEVIGNALNLFKMKAREKSISLLCDIGDEVPARLMGDPYRLNQVLVNVLNNALKFTEAGHVKLRVKTLSENVDNASIRFTVEDTGIGIEADKLTTIFNSFSQASSDTTRKFGGTGLGLTIVKSIVEYQSGAIRVDSQPGEGTTFTIDIPFDKDATPLAPAQEKVIKQESAIDYPESLSILMAEDNELNQDLSRYIFNDIGWDLDIVDNGKEAIKKLRNKTYDLVLMDIQMPEMDGYDATLVIRNEMPEPVRSIPIIALTAHALNAEVKKCLEAGMNAYISKPFKVSEMIENVTQIVNKNKPQENTPAEESVMPGKEETAMEAESQQEDSGFNLQSLQVLFANNPSSLNNIIDLFLQQTPGRVQMLGQLVADKDWGGLKSLAHKMKSSFAIIGASQLKNNMETIENDCLNGNIDPEKFNLIVNGTKEASDKIVHSLQDLLVKP